MTTSSPLNALPCPDDNSPNEPPIHFQALNDIIDSLLVPRFASAGARDTAYTNWVNAGGVMADGMVCGIAGLGPQAYLGGWKLPPLGVVPGGAAQQTSGQSVNSATEVRVVGITNLQVSLYAGRAYKLTFTTTAQTDTANALLAVHIHGKSGSGVTPANTDTQIADGSVPLPITGGPGGTTLQFSDYFTVGSSTTYVISPFIARPAGSGTVSITGNTRISVEDVGDAASLNGFAVLS